MIIRNTENGDTFEVAGKGLIIAVLMEMIPELSAEDSVRLTTQLIDDAMDTVTFF